MTGKQLKNSILQWAIQGKLVPQDPNDEPASVLLEKIRAEKARLIKEGKIKKNKKESIIYRGEDNSYYEKFADGKVVCIDDEIPFEIPDSWEWCRLKEVVFPPKYGTSNKSVENGEMPVLRMGNIQDGEIVYDKLVYSNNTDDNIKYCLIKGDLLFNRTNSAELVGKTGVYRGQRPAIYAGYIILLRPIIVNSDYLNYILGSSYARSYCKEVKTIGVQQCNINADKISNFLIPIAPESEQNRIVEKMVKVVEPLKKYDKEQICRESLDVDIPNKFKKSVLQEAIQGKLVLQDPNDEPASVLLQRIKEEKQRLVKEGKLKKKDVIDSTIFRGDDNKYYEQVDGDAMQIESDYTFPDSWGVVRLAHICRLMDGEKKEDNYVCLDAKYLRGKSSGDILSKGKFVSKGDNIILVDGENSGEVFAVPHDGYMGSTFKQLWVSSCMHLPYVLYFIQFYKDLLRNSKKGAAIPHLNKEIFYSLVVGIPPYQEQKRIAERIEEIIDKIKVV